MNNEYNSKSTAQTNNNVNFSGHGPFTFNNFNINNNNTYFNPYNNLNFIPSNNQNLNSIYFNNFNINFNPYYIPNLNNNNLSFNPNNNINNPNNNVNSYFQYLIQNSHSSYNFIGNIGGNVANSIISSLHNEEKKLYNLVSQYMSSKNWSIYDKDGHIKINSCNSLELFSYLTKNILKNNLKLNDCIIMDNNDNKNSFQGGKLYISLMKIMPLVFNELKIIKQNYYNNIVNNNLGNNNINNFVINNNINLNNQNKDNNFYLNNNLNNDINSNVNNIQILSNINNINTSSGNNNSDDDKKEEDDTQNNINMVKSYKNLKLSSINTNKEENEDNNISRELSDDFKNYNIDKNNINDEDYINHESNDDIDEK